MTPARMQYDPSTGGATVTGAPSVAPVILATPNKLSRTDPQQHGRGIHAA